MPLFVKMTNPLVYDATGDFFNTLGYDPDLWQKLHDLAVEGEDTTALSSITSATICPLFMR
jgi:hypothetical protein